MPKRFTATEKWDKVWFRKLKPEHKCFWIYIIDRCNHAGIWEVDFELASMYIGIKIDETEARKEFEKQYQELNKGSRWFIKDFIDFQYNGELNPLNKAHLSVINILKKEGAYEGLDRGLQAPKDMVKDKDKDMVKDKGKEFSIPTVNEVAAYCQERENKIDPAAFIDFYSSKGWMIGKNKMKDWRAAIRTWEAHRKDELKLKPQSIHPKRAECLDWAKDSKAGKLVDKICQGKAGK